MAMLDLIGGVLLLAVAIVHAAVVTRPQSPWARRFFSFRRGANVPVERRRRALAVYAVGYGFWGASWLITRLIQARSPDNTAVDLLFLIGILVGLVCQVAADWMMWRG